MGVLGALVAGTSAVGVGSLTAGPSLTAGNSVVGAMGSLAAIGSLGGIASEGVPEVNTDGGVSETTGIGEGMS
jgi:hypothetical protein